MATTGRLAETEEEQRAWWELVRLAAYVQRRYPQLVDRQIANVALQMLRLERSGVPARAPRDLI